MVHKVQPVVDSNTYCKELKNLRFDTKIFVILQNAFHNSLLKKSRNIHVSEKLQC